MTATIHKFMLYAPYATDPGMPERRQAVVGSHVERAHKFHAEGIMHVAGPLLSQESVASETAEKTPVGSLMIYKGERLEEVRRLVESDLYWTHGVWDKEKLVILPWNVLIGQ
ncbi:hypothetical protein B0H21DRAFT_820256 [Amylocystis lapponica]|nr:hypothetical protein B0H21DRAFT_820256 [Amylocystis lapponica]